MAAGVDNSTGDPEPEGRCPPGAVERLLAVVLLVLAVGLWAHPAGAAAKGEYRLVGPLRARDMTPFGLLVLDLAPPYAVQDADKGWAVELNVQSANNWLPSDNALQVLEQRPDPRAPLSQEDLEALLALDDDVFFVDAAVQLVAPTFHYIWNSRWAGYLTLPVLLYNGGIADSEIESFHEEFGFSSQGRELMARNEFSVAVKLQQAELAILGEPTNGGFADPVLGLRRSFSGEKWGFVVGGAVKLSVADEDKLLSTGSEDFGLTPSLWLSRVRAGGGRPIRTPLFRE